MTLSLIYQKNNCINTLQTMLCVAFIAVLVCFGTLALQAQTLNIVTKTSTLQIKTTDIDSATVQTTTLTIIKKDKTSQVIAIADIQRMTFTLATGVGAEASNSAALGILAFVKAYPNPATSTSAIEYELVRSSPVEAQIVDATGKLVKTMVLGIQQAGKHEVQWNGTNETGALVANGSYTCIIRTGSEMLTQKLIILH